MKRANAPFVFVIARLCVPKSELILLISLSFESVPHVSHSNSFVSSYTKKNHFSSECLKSVQSKKEVAANARDLMEGAARVCTLEYYAAFESHAGEFLLVPQQLNPYGIQVFSVHPQRNDLIPHFLRISSAPPLAWMRCTGRSGAIWRANWRMMCDDIIEGKHIALADMVGGRRRAGPRP